MRRFPPSLISLSVAVFAAVALGAVAPAGADELPPGFTDGKPVGSEEAQTSPASPVPQRSAEAAATTDRYFGEGPFQAVVDAVHATPRSCTLPGANGGDDALIAMVLAPVFKESSAATTPSTAPSPMTLSRYDEWNGVMSDSSGTPENNYGLYAFRNPNTAYKRAFWHPGLGIWQYDTAGLGAPLTTIEAMDVRIVAGKVAALMANKYCNPSAAQVGHAAPYTSQERRYSAWGDWGYPCTLCEQFYVEMVGGEPNFANLHTVAGIGPLGGVSARTCMLNGVPGTMPCWYVKPEVGTIQGATAWATLPPLDGGSPTSTPTPLALPFYVLDRGATEERHWMKQDTGYSIDIRASRNIGKDARPRSTQSGSGLTWTSSSQLCDITTGRGNCVPLPPPGVSAADAAVNSSNRPIAGDYNGDGRDDVLWYAPGPSADLIWLGQPGGGFSPSPLSIVGTYDDLLAGDFDHDGDDDVVVYNRSSGAAYLMRSKGNATFTLSSLGPGAGRVPFLLDSDGDGDQELFWYGKDSMPDSIWNWSGSGFSAAARVVPGSFYPFVGDFDGNGRDDVFWYAPGPTTDKLWLHRTSGGYSSIAKPVTGLYRVAIGNFDGDAADDIVFYAPGMGVDTVWFGAPGGAFASQHITIISDFTLVVASLEGNGRDGLILYAPGPSVDRWFRWGSDRSLSSLNLTLPSTHQALVGAFSVGGDDGILWYLPGSTPDTVWYR
jgi:hypothetical protein